MDEPKKEAQRDAEDEPQPTTHPDGSPIYTGARRGDFSRRRRLRPLPGSR